MATGTEKREETIQEEARRIFDKNWAASWESREMSLYERRMVTEYGAQWEGSVGEQFENKPKPEFNKLSRAIQRIISEYRNNRITVDFVAKDGNDNTDLADTLDGLFRSDEQDSVADEAYDNAFEESVKGGMGGWRLRACLENEYDEQDDRQRIRIEPIPDADTCIFFDPNSKRYDKADARWCIVLVAMDRDAYEEEYGDDVDSWPHDTMDYYFEWSTPDLVYVAEYYKVEESKERVYIYESLTGEEKRYTEKDLEDEADLRRILEATGWKLIGERDVKRRAVHKYILSGGDMLKDCGRIPGPNIPIIPEYGKRSFINGVETFCGEVRTGKDPQQAYNMVMSLLMLLASQGTKEKPIFDPEQIAGFEDEWADDLLEDFPYLRARALRDPDGNIIQNGPIGYTKAPEVPPSLAALIQVLNNDIREILGNQEAGEDLVSNVSGKAVELIQTRLDMQAFIYASNHAKSMKRCGEVWLGMAKELYVETGRKMKTVSEEGSVRQITLNEPSLVDGTFVSRNDFSEADFDVYADVGPSSSSRRAKIMQEVTGLLQYVADDPEAKGVLTMFAIANLEGEGIDELREWADRRLLQMGGREPTQEERKAIEAAQANQQPSPMDQLAIAESEKAQADADYKRADTFKTVEETRKIQAETAEIAAENDRKDFKVALDAIEKAGSALPQTSGEQMGT